MTTNKKEAFFFLSYLFPLNEAHVAFDFYSHFNHFRCILHIHLPDLPLSTLFKLQFQTNEYYVQQLDKKIKKQTIMTFEMK